MSTFNNNKKEQSQLDPGGVLKSAHSDEARALRIVDTNSLAQDNYSHFSVSYDAGNNPTKVIYKLGTQAEAYDITFVDDVSSSLNDTYFYINGGRDSREYYVWYNVAGAGTDPAISGRDGIEVAISENDPAMVVALATKLSIESTDDNIYFHISRTSNDYDTYRFTANAKGITTDATDAGSTGFTISKFNEGDEVVLDTVNVSYDVDNNPIWQGETLFGYVFNIFTAKFELRGATGSGNLGDAEALNPSGDTAIRTTFNGPYAYQHIPNIIDNILGATTYDSVSTTITSNVETVTYSNLGTPVKAVAITYTGDLWAISEVSVVVNFLLQENGDFLLQENNDRIILE